MSGELRKEDPHAPRPSQRRRVVGVDDATLRHANPEFSNIFSMTAAAITAQVPVLSENLFSVMDSGKVNPAVIYNGYTSCPLLTGYNEVMLAEFKYGFVPAESFSGLFNQANSHRLFYHLKRVGKLFLSGFECKLR
ncbi:quinone oxidoreductase [Mycena rebaudengoi]|nr:quinone oxidoreductase [Mycena rebaudengoi]